VFETPSILSEAEVLKVQSNMPINNYRNQQALNNRIVTYHRWLFVNPLNHFSPSVFGRISFVFFAVQYPRMLSIQVSKTTTNH
jgi:hypothetical protein